MSKAEQANSLVRALLINPKRREHGRAITLRFGERGGLTDTKILRPILLLNSVSPVAVPLDGSEGMIPKSFVQPPVCPEVYRQLIRGHHATTFAGRHIKMRV